ncbi:MAG TPA: class II aldolase/adducin family protein [Candidatus Binatia bacterium]|nr:class II aldolase/adducin family protein [Candidatus Binatia bacterium]
MPKLHYIIAGGTFVDVAPHLSLAAPAFGRVGRELAPELSAAFDEAGESAEVRLVLTRMAIGGAERDEAELALFAEAGIDDLRTNDDLAMLVDRLVEREDTRTIVMAAATCDFAPSSLAPAYPFARGFGKGSHPRLSSDLRHELSLAPTEKVVRRVRKSRKDVFLVAFKTTAGAAAEEQYLKGLKLLKTASCNLVLANDVRTGRNMVITPEQARYHETTDRATALEGLAEMIALRSRLTFTRATVVPGEAVPWSSPLVPASLRRVVDHCIERGAYKPFLGSTVGHFAVKVDEGTILTSRRKTDFNRLDEAGLVKIETSGPDTVIAHGFKPSVGGQSQRIIFAEHPGMDCIVHFHCPRKTASPVPVRSQREFECGSHECGKNTSDGLGRFGNVLAVMLDKHGPNVVFARDADPEEVIRFIEANFDLEGRTDEVMQRTPLLEALSLAPAYA